MGTRQRFTKDFKLEAIRFWKSSGRPAAAVARRYRGALIACQVGCFVEWYDAAAEQAMRRLGLTPVRPRRGFTRQCGVPLRLWPRYLPQLLTLGLPVCVVRETDESLGAVKARRLAEYWQPVEASP